MVLHILRGALIILAAAVASLYLLTSQASGEDLYLNFPKFTIMLGITLGVIGAVLAVDIFVRQKKLSAVSGIFLGLIAGLLAAYALSFFVDLVGVLTAPEITAVKPTAEIELLTRTESQLIAIESEPALNDIKITQQDALRAQVDALSKRIEGKQATYTEQFARREAYFNLLEGVKVIIGLITCYVGISLVIQTKDDFRFVIPYVEFAKQIRGQRPIILDTSVIIDGRILDIIDTRIMQGTLVVPQFVLNELQTIADSADKIKRARGRRGLDILQKLQAGHTVDVSIDDTEVEGANVDQKLISLAEEMRGRVMTNDFNLNKIATLRGVEVINLNDLAKSLRPIVLPGEHLTVQLVKAGENPTQGIGYLDDGTMVVVEEGRTHLNQMVDTVVTSTLQTSAGRMIFGKFAYVDPKRAGVDSPETHPNAQPAKADPDPTGSGGETPQRRRTTPAPGRNPRRNS